MTLVNENTEALPDRPRVHQLAKVLGLTSKELLAELAEHGLTIKSASAIVPADAVEAALARRNPQPDETAQPPVVEEPQPPLIEEPVKRRRRAASRPAGPPVEVEAAAQRPVTTIAAPTAEDELAKPASEPEKPRRRRATRPAGGPVVVSESSQDATTAAAVEPAVDGVEEPKADKPRRRRATRAAGSPVEVAPPQPESVEGSEEQPEPEADEKPRGRRRRGTRGRGRGAEEQPELTTEESEATDEAEDGIAAALRMAEEAAKSRRATIKDPFAVTAEGRTETLAKLADAIADEGGQDEPEEDAEAAEDERPERRRRRRGGRRRRRGPEPGDDEAAEEASDEQEEAAPEESDEQEPEDEEETGTRRRRRRRRRSSDSKSSTDDEVTGIEGSTRMEAKRQRRKENRAAGRRRAPILSEAEFLARRESVDRHMVIRQREDYTQLAVLEDSILVEHYVDRASATSLIGNVYLGRIQNVLPSMEAAFIDIGRGRNAVLYAGEVDWDHFGVTAEDRKVEKVFKSGQTVLVQVTKDPVGAKGARLTGHISLPGRYIVYSPGGHLSGISRKLPDTERSRLRQILSELISDDESVIVRTAAEGVSAEELVRDVNRLKAQWEVIEKKVAAGKAPEALYSEPDLTLRIVRDLFTEDFGKLTVQGDDAFEAISAYVGHIAPHLAERIERFEPGDDEGDLFAKYRIDEQIAKALDRKVFLPSGGSLVIDRTEAMTVIDVNTGRFTGSGGNLEATVTSNNLEAAEEIVRQLRLRDLGGIVVIDFIDMVLPSNRELLLRRLVECLGRDRTRHQVAEVTSLGLVQLTRKRIGTGLAEAFTEECEHCHGAGYLRFEDPVDSQAPADGGERKSGGRRRKKG